MITNMGRSMKASMKIKLKQTLLNAKMKGRAIDTMARQPTVDGRTRPLRCYKERYRPCYYWVTPLARSNKEELTDYPLFPLSSG